ncbi:MAG: ABC transporter ATP-binding protein [Thiotrichales bacterium]|nr:ABC transporter ATP-binding protein [Thiotrichales bacterium]
MSHLIECRDLVKNYGRIRAINQLNITVDAGQPVGLVGPNGAGKTTLFSLIAGFMKPDNGTILVNGDNNQKTGQIGILPQDAPFLQGIRVYDQLVLFARLQGMNKSRAVEEARRVTADFEVSDLINRNPGDLSYGQRKRVALAQAILGNPQLVLLDEPTSGLDPVVADDVRRLIRAKSSTTTFMISSHNLAELEDICKTIIVINEGKLVTCSSVAELRDQDQHLRLQLDREITAELLDQTGAIQGVISVSYPGHDRYELHIEYDCKDPDRLQLEVLQLLQNAGIPVVHFSRGKKLADGVVKLVRGET